METIKGFKDEELRSVYLGIFENQPQAYQIRLTAFVSMQQEFAIRDYKEKLKNTILKQIIHARTNKDGTSNIEDFKRNQALRDILKELGL